MRLNRYLPDWQVNVVFYRFFLMDRHLPIPQARFKCCEYVGFALAVNVVIQPSRWIRLSDGVRIESAIVYVESPRNIWLLVKKYERFPFALSGFSFATHPLELFSDILSCIRTGPVRAAHEWACTRGKVNLMLNHIDLAQGSILQ